MVTEDYTPVRAGELLVKKGMTVEGAAVMGRGDRSGWDSERDGRGSGVEKTAKCLTEPLKLVPIWRVLYAMCALPYLTPRPPLAALSLNWFHQ